MWNLVADVGGTNMRLAAVSDAGEIYAQHRFSSAGGLHFPEACRAFIAGQGTSPLSVAVAAAGVVQDRSVRLTNAGQGFSCDDLAQACGTDDVHILNDFEGAAWSLATVTADDVQTLQGGFAPSDEGRLIIGPGTGLGVGAMMYADGRPHVIAGEGGHVRLAPESREEVDYFEQMIAIWPEIQIGRGLAIEAEAILSGTGLPVLYQAIAQARSEPVLCETAEDVLAQGRDGSDPVARIATEMFRRFLGSLAGDFALTLNARGGVFLTGGVALRNPWLFDDAFIGAFNAGGRHTGWRGKMPVHLYQNDDFGLLGARNFLASRGAV